MIKHIKHILKGKKTNKNNAHQNLKKDLNTLNSHFMYSFSNLRKDIEEQKKWINYLYNNHKEIDTNHRILHKNHNHHEKIHNKDINNINQWIMHLHDTTKKQEQNLKHMEEQIYFAFEKYNKYLVDIYQVVSEIKNKDKNNTSIINDENSMKYIEQQNAEVKNKNMKSNHTQIYNDTPIKHYANILTRAEKNVIKELCNTNQKLSYKDLAMLTNLSSSTVKNHVCHIRHKGFPIKESNDGNGIKRYHIPENIKKVLISKNI